MKCVFCHTALLSCVNWFSNKQYVAVADSPSVLCGIHVHLPCIFRSSLSLSLFDVVTCGLLNNHSFQLMEFTVMRPCPSDLPDFSQPGNMGLLCGAAELKPLPEVIKRLAA